MVIHGNAMESVRSTKLLGVYITDDLTWTTNTTSLVRRTQQRFHFVQLIRRTNLSLSVLTTFYRDTMESSLLVWCKSCPTSDQTSSQILVRTAEKIIRTSLPSIQDLYLLVCLNRATKIVRNPTHPTPCSV